MAKEYFHEIQTTFELYGTVPSPLKNKQRMDVCAKRLLQLKKHTCILSYNWSTNHTS